MTVSKVNKKSSICGYIFKFWRYFNPHYIRKPLISSPTILAQKYIVQLALFFFTLLFKCGKKCQKILTLSMKNVKMHTCAHSNSVEKILRVSKKLYKHTHLHMNMLKKMVCISWCTCMQVHTGHMHTHL